MPNILGGRRWRGLRIGLLGGSFNPPHAGHVHISEVALKYLDLDAVWWMVTPGNPLKNNARLPSVRDRLILSQKLINHPKMMAVDIEEKLGTFRSYDTIKRLKAHFPHTQFIWLGGSEIAREFPRWYRARELMHELPFAFIARPTSTVSANGKAGHQAGGGEGELQKNIYGADHSGVIKPTIFHRHKLCRNHVLTHGARVVLAPNHVYWLFHELRSPLSSTALRAGFGGGDIVAHSNSA